MSITRITMLVALVAAGCSVGQAPPTAEPTPRPTPAPATATATATTTPGQPTATPRPTDQADQPPDGLLSTGDDPVAGWLGTYCWLDTCVDVMQTAPKPDLPLLEASSTQTELAFTVSGDVTFSQWSASYAADSNADVTPLGSGGDFFDPDSTASQPPLLDEVRFASPPSGDWVVHVFVSFAGQANRGDASYAWHVTVP